MRVNISLDQDVLVMLDAAAKLSGMSRSAFIRWLLMTYGMVNVESAIYAVAEKYNE